VLCCVHQPLNHFLFSNVIGRLPRHFPIYFTIPPIPFRAPVESPRRQVVIDQVKDRAERLAVEDGDGGDGGDDDVSHGGAVQAENS